MWMYGGIFYVEGGRGVGGALAYHQLIYRSGQQYRIRKEAKEVTSRDFPLWMLRVH
jgi:hypothetical protein